MYSCLLQIVAVTWTALTSLFATRLPLPWSDHAAKFTIVLFPTNAWKTLLLALGLQWSLVVRDGARPRCHAYRHTAHAGDGWTPVQPDKIKSWSCSRIYRKNCNARSSPFAARRGLTRKISAKRCVKSGWRYSRPMLISKSSKI